jgi:GT2 family glycosyltransferase
MRVLAHIHTFNDADVIDHTIEMILRQTRPVDGILVVDNGSTDGTLDQPNLKHTTVLRHDRNLGTSGAVVSGMRFAIEHGYDWIWIFDADSSPKLDALENLMRCFTRLNPKIQSNTWWLSSLLIQDGRRLHGCNFTSRGIEMIDPRAAPSQYPCHTNMWSGSLYRLDLVQQVGLPNPDYVLDWGDVIYGYEGLLSGYIGFVEQSSLVVHRHHPAATLRYRRIGPRTVKVFYSPPIRCYYHWRNSTYFWLYRYAGENRAYLRVAHLVLYLKSLIKVVLLLNERAPLTRAYLLGFWHGLHGRLTKRW